LETRTMPDAALAAALNLGALSTNSAAYDPGHVLVQFAPGVNPASVLPAGAALGPALPLVSNLYQVQLAAGWTVPQTIAALQNHFGVVFVQPDYQLSANLVPNDL